MEIQREKTTAYKEVSELIPKKFYIVWCILIIISCQVPPTPVINEKTVKPKQDKITKPKKQITKQAVQKTIAPIVKLPSTNYNLSKTEKPIVQEISQKSNLLANWIKVVVKEIEEPVGRDQSQTQVEAFLLKKAKRLAVEEAGTYISSLQIVKQGQMTEEQVNALASGILQTEIVDKPQIRIEKGVMLVKVKAKIQVDTSVLAHQVETLMKNKSMMLKLANQQARIKELESQISGLKSSDIKRLESLNVQALSIEKQRTEQRHFLEQQRLVARKAIQDAQLKQIQREKILNQEFQEILKTQETARKQEQEAIAREQDLIKRARLENEAALKELARKAQIQQALWHPFDQSLSAQQALEEAQNLRKEIYSVKQSLDDQYQKNIFHLKTAFEKQVQFTHPNLPANPPPRDMFETTEEFQRRMARYEEKVQKAKNTHAMKIDLIRKEQALCEIQLKKEWLIQKKVILAPFVRRLGILQSKKFTVPDTPITIKVEEPEADRFRFPMLIMCQGERYQRYWKYSNRQSARNLWKTRKFFQGVGVHQLTEFNGLINFMLTGCNITHHGIIENRFYSFQKNKTLNEIVRWHAIDLKIKKNTDKEIQDQKAVMRIRFLVENPPFIEPITGIEFIPVPGGCFEMGDWSFDCSYCEDTVVRKCVSNFFMSKYEITQAQWQKIMGNNPSLYFNCGGNCPVEQVSWFDVQNFIQNLNTSSKYKGFRLPTEKEWEYACRSAGKEELYCGGQNLDALGWYSKNSGGTIHPVGLKQPNGLGLYDMSGNVEEWCHDAYKEGGFTRQGLRIVRNCSWGTRAYRCESHNRYKYSRRDKGHYLGFRLVFSYLKQNQSHDIK